MARSTYPRVLGMLTAGYGLFTLSRPASLVHAAGLEAQERPVTRTGQALGRVVGVRDLLSGLAMVIAQPGTPMQTAVAARVAFDVGDLIGFGLAAPPRSRAKVVAVTTGWALLCASSWPAAGEPQ